MSDVQELYDRDFNLWAEETAAALRAGRLTAIDVEHLAEEIEEMGQRDTREL
jgi:hypothetical protein